MPSEHILPTGSKPAELDKDAVMAAEISDPLEVPTEAVRVIWMRAPFSLRARPFLVDARRLPWQG